MQKEKTERKTLEWLLTVLCCYKRLFFTFHFEDSVLRHFFAITLNLLLDSLLEVFVRGADHHGLALEACKQAHFPLLTRGRQVSLGEERGKKPSYTLIPQSQVYSLENFAEIKFSARNLHDPGCSSSSCEQRSQ